MTNGTVHAPKGRNSGGNNAKRLVTSSLHPKVYAALIAPSLWFVVWVWSFLGGGETGYLLFIVSGFIGVVVALQLILSCVARPTETTDLNVGPADDDRTPSFRDWLHGDFDIQEGSLRSVEAAIIILLPIAAAAIGMMAFGIEFQIVEHAGV
jgi:hypothetical protein